ncbi:MAG: helix-turn-helix transcriptional regulator [Bacteroidota bacterium]
MESKQANIPDIDFEQGQQKAFEFQIVSNREILSGNFRGGHTPFRPHRIQFYAILFVIEGEGRHFIDFNSHTYKRGSIIFIAKDQVQRFERNLKREAFLMLFTQAFLEKSSMGSNLMQQLSLYNYHLYTPVLQLEERQMGLFMGLIRQMKREFAATEDSLTEEIILSSLKIFLCLAERIRKEKMDFSGPRRYHKAFTDFEKLLQQHLLQERQVSFYANQLSISTKKLNRITQSVVQQTAKNYIHSLLILEIKRLLVNTSLSIKEIAFTSGFEEPTNFVKYFKKFAQLTPGEFRKQYDQS